MPDAQAPPLGLAGNSMGMAERNSSAVQGSTSCCCGQDVLDTRQRVYAVMPGQACCGTPDSPCRRAGQVSSCKGALGCSQLALQMPYAASLFCELLPSSSQGRLCIVAPLQDGQLSCQVSLSSSQGRLCIMAPLQDGQHARGACQNLKPCILAAAQGACR